MAAPLPSPDLEAALRRFLDLTPRDQLAAYTAMREHLGERVGETERDREIRERSESLDALEKIAEALGLPPGKAPTSGQFNEHAPKAAPGWNSSRVQRLWGRWRFALDAYEGRRARRTDHQLDVQRLVGNQRRPTDHYLRALQLWLATNPKHITTGQYERWAMEFNDRLPPGELPLPRWMTINNQLGRVGFHDAVRVARGELDLAEAQQLREERMREARYAQEHPGETRRAPTEQRVPLREHWTSTEHEFVGIDWIARQYQLAPHAVSRQAGRWGFPAPAATFSRTRVWLREEIEAYYCGEDVPHHEPNRLQQLYLSAGEVAALIDRPARILDGFRTSVPRPAGSVSSRRYYLRSEVEQWMGDNPQRLGPKAKPRGSAKKPATA